MKQDSIKSFKFELLNFYDFPKPGFMALKKT